MACFDQVFDPRHHQLSSLVSKQWSATFDLKSCTGKEQSITVCEVLHDQLVSPEIQTNDFSLCYTLNTWLASLHFEGRAI